MPPPKSNRRLSAEQKAILERWIAEGAAYAPHWAFVAPMRPPEPAVRRADWVRESDRPVRPRQARSRRAGPVAGSRPGHAHQAAVDRSGGAPADAQTRSTHSSPIATPKRTTSSSIACSPSRHYGERMALGWLDAARYADSNGFQQDGDTWQWVWRDWVVRALNDDLPFDQFTIWQLAGDLLPDATIDQKIASGFNRNHLLNGEGGAIPEEQRFVNLFDRVDTTATTWLGLTMACAQCHDHKFDPITQRDYYGLLDAFNRVPESGTPQFFSSRIRVAAPFIELPTEENKAGSQSSNPRSRRPNATRNSPWTPRSKAGESRILGSAKPAEGNGLPDGLAAILRKPEADRTEVEKTSLDRDLRKHFDDKVRPNLAGKLPPIARLDELKKQLASYRDDQVPRVMVMSDAKPRQTAILTRGEYLKPAEKVSFSTPQFLPPLPKGSPTNRLGLARWLVSPEHPLTARVQVNRMWQHIFGTGIVKTPEDFGVQSEYPIHGALLDWLAVEFRTRGWSMKAMHKLIVTSATYRQSSRVTPDHRARDIENRLLARSSRFRMSSLILRDWALGLGRLARSADRRVARLSLPARRDLGGPRDHEGARLHLSGVLGQRPLSPQPLHVLAAHRQPGQHVRCLESADVSGAIDHDQHAAARPHDAQRPHLGRGRPDARSSRA